MPLTSSFDYTEYMPAGSINASQSDVTLGNTRLYNVIPPSNTMAVPVVYVASSLAK